MTKQWGKWIGGGLGFAVGGPAGALLGFSLGTLLDQVEFDKLKNSNGVADIDHSILLLSAVVIKADPRKVLLKKQKVRLFFRRTFGHAGLNERMQLFDAHLKRTYPIREICTQIHFNTKKKERINLLYYLYSIAVISSPPNSDVLKLIDDIGSFFELTRSEINGAKRKFSREVKEIDNRYILLGIRSSAKDKEVKAAYRKKVLANHPDKTQHLPEAERKRKSDHFRMVKDAYESIKKERNLN